MTYHSHCQLSPTQWSGSDEFFLASGGNLAAAWCYLGFVFAYGWSCWHAYVVNEKPDLTSRVNEGNLRMGVQPRFHYVNNS